MQSIGLKTKNDRIDAKGLSRMGAEQNLAQWDAPDEHLMGLRAVTRQRESLQSTRTQLNNQLKSMEAGQFVNEELTKQQKAIIALIDKQILETEAMIKNIIANNAEMKEKVNKITEIKGLGVISVATVIAETFGFKYFTSQRQLVSYSGYDVIENQSGKRIGKTKISKKGNSHIRRILHMPSFSVVTNNEPIFLNLYERVYASSKLKMKAYVAVQRKLLTIIYTLWKKNESYDNQYHIKNLPVMQS